MKKKIIIVAGDPNSINCEIISKTWRAINTSIKRKIYLIGNFNLINKQFKKLKRKVSIIKVKQLEDNSSPNKLKIIDIPLNFKNPFKVSLQNSKKYIYESFNLAHKLAQNKKVKGLINCPIDKKLLNKSKKIGVTEFLASKNKINKGSEVMFIHNKKLSVVPITTHINIKNVSKKISINLIIKKINTLQKDFKMHGTGADGSVWSDIRSQSIPPALGSLWDASRPLQRTKNNKTTSVNCTGGAPHSAAS